MTPIAARVGGTVLRSVRHRQPGGRGRHGAGRDRSARLSSSTLERRAPSSPTPRRPRWLPARRADHVDDGDEQRVVGRGGIEQADASVREAEQAIDAAKARLVTAQARLREAEANASQDRRDVERFKRLLAKDEISQQQFDATVAAADAASAGRRFGARADRRSGAGGPRGGEPADAGARRRGRQAPPDCDGRRRRPVRSPRRKARADAADARVRRRRRSSRRPS